MSAHHQFYDRDGRPIDRDTWSRLKDDRDYVLIAYTPDLRMPGEARRATVSTVWTGHNTDPFGPALVFETAVWLQDPAGCRRYLEITKYPTEHAAALGHVVVVDRVRAGAVQDREEA